MRADARTLLLPLLLGCTLALGACGDKNKTGNSVQMKDMEVVDGTATDAMTDLDGVQSEGTSVTMPGANASNATAPASAKGAAPVKTDNEVLSDQ